MNRKIFALKRPIRKKPIFFIQTAITFCLELGALKKLFSQTTPSIKKYGEVDLMENMYINLQHIYQEIEVFQPAQQLMLRMGSGILIIVSPRLLIITLDLNLLNLR
jgi:hypothetical protein